MMWIVTFVVFAFIIVFIWSLCVVASDADGRFEDDQADVTE